MRAAALALLILAGAAGAQDAPVPAALRDVVVAISERTLRIEELPPGLFDEETTTRFRELVERSGPRPVGTGLVTAAEGLVLTTARLNDPARMEFKVRFADGREFPAKVLGSDRRTDLTLLQFEGGAPVPPARRADLSRVKPGDPVTGVAFRAGETLPVASGGAVQRLELDLATTVLQTFLETDVGNVPGPLFNRDGEVIGINAYFHRTEPRRAFAIPINLALHVQEQLRQHGRVIRGRLGFTLAQASPEVAAAAGRSVEGAASVQAVEQNGPAAHAGLVPGDLILDIAGTPIPRPGLAVAVISLLRPGTPVTIRVWRAGRSEALTAIVGEAAPDPPTNFPTRPTNR